MPDPPSPPSGGGGGGPAPASPAWLRTRTFGMPRWAFLALLVGAVGVGLYLRNRAAQAADVTAEGDVPQSVSDQLAGTEDPSLAGAGVLAGPAGGQVVPVQAPVIPQGYPETFDTLGGVIGELGSAIASRDPAQQPPPVVNVQVVRGKGPAGKAGRPGKAGKPGKPKKPHKPARQRATHAMTGGGPPSARPARRDPHKPHKRK